MHEYSQEPSFLPEKQFQEPYLKPLEQTIYSYTLWLPAPTELHTSVRRTMPDQWQLYIQLQTLFKEELQEYTCILPE